MDAQTNSHPAIKKPAPDFTLTDLGGTQHTLSDYQGRIVVINFWSAECPWSARADTLLEQYLKDWGESVVLLPIASNANESLEMLTQVSIKRNLSPVLHDVNRDIANMYGAETTPHLFVIDAQGILRYQGAINDVTFRQRKPTQHYLKEVVDALRRGEEPEPVQTPPYGCTIVYYPET